MGRKKPDRDADALFRHEMMLLLSARDMANVEFISAERAGVGRHLVTTTDVIRYALIFTARLHAAAATYGPAEKEGGAK